MSYNRLSLELVTLPYQLYDEVWEGSSFTWLTSLNGFDCGQVSIEPATHS